jgi:hypothetical protein
VLALVAFDELCPEPLEHETGESLVLQHFAGDEQEPMW